MVGIPGPAPEYDAESESLLALQPVAVGSLRRFEGGEWATW